MTSASQKKGTAVPNRDESSAIIFLLFSKYSFEPLWLIQKIHFTNGSHLQFAQDSGTAGSSQYINSWIEYRRIVFLEKKSINILIFHLRVLNIWNSDKYMSTDYCSLIARIVFIWYKHRWSKQKEEKRVKWCRVKCSRTNSTKEKKCEP